MRQFLATVALIVVGLCCSPALGQRPEFTEPRVLGYTHFSNPISPALDAQTLIAKYLPMHASAPTCSRPGQMYWDTVLVAPRVCSVAGSPGTWGTVAVGSFGDVSGPASSVDSEIALFSGTGGKTLKRATGSGFVKATSGVFSTVANVTESDLSLSDNTTNDASATKHGLLLKLENTGTKFLRDDGSWQTVSSLTMNATDGVVPYRSSSSAFSDSPLSRADANTVEQRNGVNGQAFFIYETYTDPGSYKRMSLDNWKFTLDDSFGVKTEISYEDAGGGGTHLKTVTNQPLHFWTNNIKRFQVSESGHLLTEADNTYDIGDDTHRPKTIKLGTSAIAPTVQLVPVAFTSLPGTPSEGMMAWVNDSNTATWGATAAGGGANKVLLVYNGTNWTVAGK